MGKLSRPTGKLMYWAGWPLLFLVMYGSQRTRVLVVADGKLVAVKSWLGAGYWNLPGGGLRKGEDPAAGAARELAEETGIKTDPGRLQHLHTGRVKDANGIRYTEICFLLPLPKPKPLQQRQREIREAVWIAPEEFIRLPDAKGRAREIVQAWLGL